MSYTVYDYYPTTDIFKLENDISSLIKDRSVHFTYSWYEDYDEEYVVMKVYTFNEDQNSYFLLEKLTEDNEGSSKTRNERYQENTVRLLQKLKDQIKKTNKSDYKNFTIVWSSADDEHKKKHTSYFYASTLGYALRKLYADRDEKLFMIHEVKLNPVS